MFLYLLKAFLFFYAQLNTSRYAIFKFERLFFELNVSFFTSWGFLQIKYFRLFVLFNFLN